MQQVVCYQNPKISNFKTILKNHIYIYTLEKLVIFFTKQSLKNHGYIIIYFRKT